MYRFIYNSLRQMLNSTYLSLLFLYAILCWMISDISFTQKGALPSKEILQSYNMIILSLVMMNVIYFIITHFRETLNSRSRDILITRLGKEKYFWGLIICYAIYFLGFNVLPLYMAAFFQQIFYGSTDIIYSDYIREFISVIIKTGFWPVVLSVVLIVWIKNDLLTLMIWSAVYFIIYGINVVSDLYKTGDSGSLVYILPVIINVTISLAVLFCGVLISRKLLEFEYNEKISGGLFPFIADKLKLELSKFHYKMLGLKTQTLFLIMGALGFIFTISLLSGMNANNVVIAKIYAAVFFPLLFSFNQYNLIAVDKESGMIVINILRRMDYSRIVLNRWFTMLVPQIILSIVFSFILFRIIEGINISFVVYVILLNILFSSMNFFLSVYFNRSGYANFLVGFIAYMMLREDIQIIFNSNKVLNYFNILGNVTSFSNHNPAAVQILIPFCISFIFITSAYSRLKKCAIRI